MNNKKTNNTLEQISEQRITKNQITTNLIINPLEKLSNNISIVDKLIEIAREGFGTEMTREDVINHVLKTDFLYLIHNNDKLQGFSSYNNLKAFGSEILYLNGIVLCKELQKKGVFHQVNQLAMNTKKYDYLAMRTQNPVIYAATEAIVEKIYPNIEKTMSKEIQEIGTFIAKNYLKMNDFCQDTFVGRNTYGVCLYDKIPRHIKADLLFDDILQLNYDKGDSVIIVGKVK